jgi:hypothetical protein
MGQHTWGQRVRGCYHCGFLCHSREHETTARVLQASHAVKTFCCTVLRGYGCHVLQGDTWLWRCLCAQCAYARAPNAPQLLSCLARYTAKVWMFMPARVAAGTCVNGNRISHGTAQAAKIVAGMCFPPPYHSARVWHHARPQLPDMNPARLHMHTCCHLVLV